MRIESRKQTEGTRTPRRRVDMQGTPGTLYTASAAGCLTLLCDVHAGASQEPRRASLSFTAAETDSIRDILTRDMRAELAALREIIAAGRELEARTSAEREAMNKHGSFSPAFAVAHAESVAARKRWVAALERAP
jgi:hypothetical protein